MSNENKIIKSISFRKDDEHDMELYKHAMKNKYFASYVKRLIYIDLKKDDQNG